MPVDAVDGGDALGPDDEAPEVTVLTPTLGAPERRGWLVELHASLAANEARWEWIVVADGVAPDALPEVVRADPRVRLVALPRRCGAAAARNLGLAEARAGWVTSCDDDDLLTEGALDLRLAATDDRVGWVGARLAELFEDTGEVRPWDHPAPTGWCAPGDVWASWRHPDGDVPLGPTTLLVRTTLLRAVGGWQGLPQAEDLGMAVAVTSQAPGILLDDVVYLYRKHPGMIRRSPGFDRLEAVALATAHERGRCIDAVRSGPPTPAPARTADADGAGQPDAEGAGQPASAREETPRHISGSPYSVRARRM